MTVPWPLSPCRLVPAVFPLVLACCCGAVTSPTPPAPATQDALAASTDETVAAGFLDVAFPPADGFELQGGTGEQTVRAVARGRVASVATEDGPRAGVVVIDHLVYENHEKRSITSVYTDLRRIDVAEGDVLERGQTIGSADDGGHLQLKEGATALSATDFVHDLRELFVPQEEPAVVLVDIDARRLQLWEEGALVEDVEIAIGQREGRKREEGDLMTPRGMYFVVDRYKGEIGGAYGAWYGGHWIKINYPNRYDAEWGLGEGLVSGTQAVAITRAWERQALTDQSTAVGSGIGFHGWAEEWEPETHGTLLSWGCVVLHLRDVSRIYDRVPEGTMVILL